MRRGVRMSCACYGTAPSRLLGGGVLTEALFLMPDLNKQDRSHSGAS